MPDPTTTRPATDRPGAALPTPARPTRCPCRRAPRSELEIADTAAGHAPNRSDDARRPGPHQAPRRRRTAERRHEDGRATDADSTGARSPADALAFLEAEVSALSEPGRPALPDRRHRRAPSDRSRRRSRRPTGPRTIDGPWIVRSALAIGAGRASRASSTGAAMAPAVAVRAARPHLAAAGRRRTAGVGATGQKWSPSGARTGTTRWPDPSVRSSARLLGQARQRRGPTAVVEHRRAGVDVLGDVGVRGGDLLVHPVELPAVEVPALRRAAGSARRRSTRGRPSARRCRARPRRRCGHRAS